MRDGKKRQHAYPRPQLRRDGWVCLDGRWKFALDPESQWEQPESVKWDSSINVPFAPETPLSGIEATGLNKAAWYRRTFDAPEFHSGERLLLHFGAVDYQATVWVNGRVAARHEGGYSPFSTDITGLLLPEGPQNIVVRAEDDPLDLEKPRGKQDWKPEPHSIWYYRTTGIWQSVWLEVVPETYVGGLRWMPDARKWEIGLEVRLGGVRRADLHLHLRLTLGERLLADDVWVCDANEMTRRIAIPDPGIDDARNEILWHPDSPNLIDAELELRDRAGNVIDRVASYTALRSIALLGNRFVLNEKPFHLRLVLDQGYWADGGLTAPDDEALRRDVELAKAMGFNGVRKHQKIEDPRYLYWADRLGLLVWEEMPSAYSFSQRTAERVTSQWTEAILRDISHPCIVAWVPFNESWGVPDLPHSLAQRSFVQAMYHLTKALDPSRPVIGNDGWEALVTDIVTIHDYDADPERIARRYPSSMDGICSLLREERPGNKLLALDGFVYKDQPVVLSEFGGIAFSRDRARTWGYSRAGDSAEFARRYYRLMSAVRSLRLLAGFCYTQFTDTYQEANGLMYMDRTPKFPLHEIAVATRGPNGPEDDEVEAAWRDGREPTRRRSRNNRKVRAER